jgi:threonine/homoserine/homoserine lactone efflux protein
MLAAVAGWEPFGRLVLTSLAVMGSPGPVTISLVAAGSAYGTRRTLRYVGGIVLGTVAVLLAVASGLTAALLAVRGLHPVLVAVSAAYILWLAWRIATAPPHTDASVRAPSFRGGLVLAIANPKAWVAIGAVFSSVRVVHGVAADAAAKVGVLALMIVAINVVWLAGGSSLAPLLRDPRRSRLVNAGLAAALVASTALLI